MSKPKYYWYTTVQKMVKRYPYLKDEESIQAGIFMKAIHQSINETSDLPDGDDRLSAISSICLYQTDTVEGIALKKHYSERTVQRWVNSFINMVGKKAGF